MARIAAELKRGFLRSILREAQAASPQITLATALGLYQESQFSNTKSGRVIVSTGGNGKSVTFNMPQIGLQLMQDEIMALTEEFFAVYADALVTLGVAGTNPAGDPAIFAQMLLDDRMQTITEMRMDFTLIRSWTTGAGINQ